MNRSLLFSLMLGAIALTPLVGAQDAAQATPADFAREVMHLPKDAVKEQVDAQFTKVQAAVKALNDLRKAGQPAGEAEQVRDREISLLEAGLKDFAAKGGDRAEYDQYIGAVAGLGQLTDKGASEWVDTVKNWFVDPEGGLKWAKNIILFLVVLFAARIIAGIAGSVVRRGLGAAKKLNISDILKDFFVGTTKKLVFFMGLVVALTFLGVDIGPFLAGIGVLGFVVGFALQDTLGNFAAGLMILLYRPYDLGNVVNAAGVTGKVHAMSLVSTTLRTPDNQDIIVPNGSIWGGVITNVTVNETRRVDMTFGIGYGDDIAKAQKVLEEVVAAHAAVLKDPAPTIKVHELADSSVNFVCRPWCKTSDYWDVYFDLTRTVKERFDQEGISIPFPQQDVHMHQVSS